MGGTLSETKRVSQLHAPVFGSLLTVILVTYLIYKVNVSNFVKLLIHTSNIFEPFKECLSIKVQFKIQNLKFTKRTQAIKP